jgi:hypothetical protein
MSHTKKERRRAAEKPMIKEYMANLVQQREAHQMRKHGGSIKRESTAAALTIPDLQRVQKYLVALVENWRKF